MQMKMLNCTKWPMKTRKEIWILVKIRLFFKNFQANGIHLFYHVYVWFVKSLNWTKMGFGNDQNMKFWGWSVIFKSCKFGIFIDYLSFWKKYVLLLLETKSYLIDFMVLPNFLAAIWQKTQFSLYSECLEAQIDDSSLSDISVIFKIFFTFLYVSFLFW